MKRIIWFAVTLLAPILGALVEDMNHLMVATLARDLPPVERALQPHAAAGIELESGMFAFFVAGSTGCTSGLQEPDVFGWRSGHRPSGQMKVCFRHGDNDGGGHEHGNGIAPFGDTTISREMPRVIGASGVHNQVGTMSFGKMEGDAPDAAGRG